MARKRKTNPVKEVVIKDEQQAKDALQQIRNLAAEFFDVGVILMSREVDGQTDFLHTAFGNQFGVKGMIQVYVNEYINDQLEDVDGYDDNEL